MYFRYLNNEEEVYLYFEIASLSLYPGNVLYVLIKFF